MDNTKLEQRREQLTALFGQPALPDKSAISRLELRDHMENLELEILALIQFLDDQLYRDELHDITFKVYMQMSNELVDARRSMVKAQYWTHRF